jgi:hypothetical protein
MGVDPILIVDTSVFWALTLDGYRRLGQLFRTVLPPIPAFEVVGNLSPDPPKSSIPPTPASYVQQLAGALLLASAAMAPLLHHAHVVEIEGDSYGSSRRARTAAASV